MVSIDRLLNPKDDQAQEWEGVYKRIPLGFPEERHDPERTIGSIAKSTFGGVKPSSQENPTLSLPGVWGIPYSNASSLASHSKQNPSSPPLIDELINRSLKLAQNISPLESNNGIKGLRKLFNELPGIIEIPTKGIYLKYLFDSLTLRKLVLCENAKTYKIVFERKIARGFAFAAFQHLLRIKAIEEASQLSMEFAEVFLFRIEDILKKLTKFSFYFLSVIDTEAQNKLIFDKLIYPYYQRELPPLASSLNHFIASIRGKPNKWGPYQETSRISHIQHQMNTLIIHSLAQSGTRQPLPQTASQEIGAADGSLPPWVVDTISCEGDEDELIRGLPELLKKRHHPHGGRLLENQNRGLIFASSVEKADAIQNLLKREHGIPSKAVHSGTKDKNIERIVNYKAGKIKCLVGVDIQLIKRVDLPADWIINLNNFGAQDFIQELMHGKRLSRMNPKKITYLFVRIEAIRQDNIPKAIAYYNDGKILKKLEENEQSQPYLKQSDNLTPKITIQKQVEKIPGKRPGTAELFPPTKRPKH